MLMRAMVLPDISSARPQTCESFLGQTPPPQVDPACASARRYVRTTPSKDQVMCVESGRDITRIRPSALRNAVLFEVPLYHAPLLNNQADQASGHVSPFRSVPAACGAGSASCGASRGLPGERGSVRGRIRKLGV